MQVADIKYKDYIKEICNISKPLNWFLRIFSLYSQRKKYKYPYIMAIKCALPAIILGVLNCLTLYYKFTYVYVKLTISVMYTDAVQMVYDIFQYTVDLVFVYKYGAEICFEYVKQYAYIDGLLGRDYYATIRRRLIKIMVILFTMWLLTSIFDYIIWWKGFGFQTTTIYSIAYIYIFIKILTNLDSTVNIMQVESRLRALSEIIQECCNTAKNARGVIEDRIKTNWFYNRKTKIDANRRLHSINIMSFLNPSEVTWLNRCYLLLTEQVAFINKMYGMRILLNSVSLLIDIVRFINLTVLILIGSQTTGYENGCYAAIATCMRTIVCIAVIISLVDHCDRVYRERDRLVYLLDDLIINKDLDKQILIAFKEFRDLVQSRQINFHMADFVRIDYPLLVSITSVVVTYTILLLQNK